MAEAHACPECGAPLPADAPEGLCPSCLLHSGLASAWMLSPRKSSASPPGPFVAPDPAELARHFPQLEMLAILGQGGMGAVYQARQTKLDRLVALKVLPPNLVQDPAFAERFTREARALARLSHPNIVSVHDFGESGGLYYFIMEYVDGASLRQVLLEGRLSPGESLKIVPQLCDALQYAHDEGVVHRDIKPENILLDKRGRVKIADFGLAKLVGVAPANYTLTGSRQIMGTPHYMAPEQMEKPQTVDHRADIYSLGVVLYEMLTGELPLGRFAPPSQKAPVDARLDEVVLRALAKEPQERYQTVNDLKAEVEHSQPGPRLVPWVGGGKRRFGTRFTASDNWCSQAQGLVCLEGDALVFEYAMDYLGFYKSPVKEKRVALADLVQCELERGWWDATLIVGSSRLSALDGIPGGSLGQARLTVAGKDRKAAEDLVQAVQARVAPHAAAAYVPEGGGPEVVQMRIAVPAAGLLVSAIIAPLFWSILGIMGIAEEGPRFRNLGGPVGFILIAVIVGCTVVGLSAILAAGSWHLRRTTRYGLVVLAAVVAVIPWSPHVLFGLPAGVWIFMELSRLEVKQAFLGRGWQPRRPAPAAPPPRPAEAPPTGFFRRRARSVLRGFRTLFFDTYMGPPEPEDDPQQVPTTLHTPPPAASSPDVPVARFAEAEEAGPRRHPPFRRPRPFLKFVVVSLLVFAGLVFVTFLLYASRRSGPLPFSTVAYQVGTPATRAADDGLSKQLEPDEAIRNFLTPLRLDPSRRDQVKRLLKEAHQEYLQLEDQERTVSQDDGRRRHVRIEAIWKSPDPPAKWTEFEDRLWSNLDKVLNPEQQQSARSYRGHLLQFLFPASRTTFEIRMEKMGEWYNWAITPQPTGFAPSGLHPEISQGRTLPPFLQRYWKLTEGSKPPAPKTKVK